MDLGTTTPDLRKAAVRLFDQVSRLAAFRGGVLGVDDLAAGFQCDRQRFPLINPQRCIFKPRELAPDQREVCIGESTPAMTRQRVARRPSGADPPRLASSPERTLPAIQGRLPDGGSRRPINLGALCRGFGAPGMVRRPVFCHQPATDGEP
jgi:hypothetical protein